jgi:signal transduction histidine kinase
MMKSSIRNKLILSYFVIVVVTLLISGIIFSVYIPKYLVGATERSLTTEAKQIVQDYVDSTQLINDPIFQRRVLVSLASRTIEGASILVDIRTGEVLNKNKQIVISNMNALVKAIRPQILKNEAFTDVFPEQNPDYVLVAYPVFDPTDTQPSTVLILITKLQDIQDISREIVRILLNIFIVVGSIVILLGIFMARSITSPIKLLKKAVQRLNKRDFTPPEIVRTGDELEDFSDTLRNVVQELKHYDEGQRRFLQNASHELKTPLMAIQGYAEGIKDGIFEGEEAAKGLDTIVDESIRLKRLVDELIYLSKLETLQDVYHPVLVNAAEVLADAVERIKSLALKGHIVIEVNANGPSEEFLIRIDRDKCLQAFINLIGNAIRHAHSKVICTCTRQKDRVVIEIRDDGEGFRDEDLSKIFERFYKGDKGDTGLGLAITRAIIQRSDGTIVASNHPSGGGLITISLPIA